jgi:hypothetical protein
MNVVPATQTFAPATKLAHGLLHASGTTGRLQFQQFQKYLLLVQKATDMVEKCRQYQHEHTKAKPDV